MRQQIIPNQIAYLYYLYKQRRYGPATTEIGKYFDIFLFSRNKNCAPISCLFVSLLDRNAGASFTFHFVAIGCEKDRIRVRTRGTEALLGTWQTGHSVFTMFSEFVSWTEYIYRSIRVYRMNGADRRLFDRNGFHGFIIWIHAMHVCFLKREVRLVSTSRLRSLGLRTI